MVAVGVSRSFCLCSTDPRTGEKIRWQFPDMMSRSTNIYQPSFLFNQFNRIISLYIQFHESLWLVTILPETWIVRDVSSSHPRLDGRLVGQFLMSSSGAHISFNWMP